jgi:hypothetical protein
VSGERGNGAPVSSPLQGVTTSARRGKSPSAQRVLSATCQGLQRVEAAVELVRVLVLIAPTRGHNMNVVGSPNSRRSCSDLPYEGSQLGDAHGFGDLDRVSSSPPQGVTTGYSPGRLGLWRRSSSPLRGATTRRASPQRSGPIRSHRPCERPQHEGRARRHNLDDRAHRPYGGPQPHSLGLCQPCDPCPHNASERSQRTAVVGLSDVLGSPHRPSEGSQPLCRGGGQHLPPCRHRPSDGSQSSGHGPHGLLDCAVLINPERCHNLSPCFLAADTVPGPHRPSEGSQPVVLATLVGEFARPHRPYEGPQQSRPGRGAHDAHVVIDPPRGHNTVTWMGGVIRIVS